MTRKPVIVRRVLGWGVVVGLFLTLYGAPTAGAQTGVSPAAVAAPTTTPPPYVNVVVSYCWCPDVAKMVPSDVTVAQQLGEQVIIVNQLSEEADLIDQQGAVAARVAPGASAPLQLPGPGTYRYVLVSPPSPNPAVLTVHAQG
jgi:hypothetical protein